MSRPHLATSKRAAILAVGTLAAVLVAAHPAHACGERITFDDPTAVNRYGTALPIWADGEDTPANGDAFCQAHGYASMYSYTIGCGEDESTYVDWGGNEWIGRGSGDSNLCYDIFDSITCRETARYFYNPRRRNQFGTLQSIWADGSHAETNGDAYCSERRGHCSMVSYATSCGEDESSYVDADGNDWVSRASGSSNLCYDIFDWVLCD